MSSTGRATEIAYADLHGYRKIADIMRGPEICSLAASIGKGQMSLMTREMFCLMRAMPHRRLHPGGVGIILYGPTLYRLPRPPMKYVEFMKKVVLPTTTSTSSTSPWLLRRSAAAASCWAAGALTRILTSTLQL